MLLRGANAVGYTNYPDNAVFKYKQIHMQAFNSKYTEKIAYACNVLQNQY